MAHRLEIALRPELFDAEGDGIRRKAKDYLGIELHSVRCIHVITIDANLTANQLNTIQTEIFTNPVTQLSSHNPLDIAFDWTVWVGFRPGVRDNPGSTAVEAVEDILDIKFASGEAIYTSKRYCLKGKDLDFKDVNTIAGELLANDIIQQWKIFSNDEWDPITGTGLIIPKVILNHTPKVTTISVHSDLSLKRISDERGLALNPADIPFIRSYFMDKKVRAGRAVKGLSDPTDVELEYISQARSDHCNHNTFRGLFRYRDLETGETDVMDNGGAITGIVGVYRDPMGTGKGSRLVMGGYGFCVGPRDYNGALRPHLHPRRLLDGVIEGVRDGGNKSGIPTTFGQVLFDHGYLGKCLVFVTALGMMPARIREKPAEQKKTTPGDLVIMCGGRVGKDGIHGVTASSETFSEHTPAGHVQIGDPYTQKKMHDFLLDARDEGLIQFVTDNGGGGLSSSVGESARFSNGCEIQLEKVPLKYEGLDQWEIWISESQERMTVAVRPEDLERFLALSKMHAVESTVIGRYTDSGKLYITYNGSACAYIDMDLTTSGFPQWEFDAEWLPPERRGLHEPVLKPPGNYRMVLLDMLSRPDICSKEWISRQYDHEVQGTSVIKPLVGAERDVSGDAAVIRPILSSSRGLAFAQALLPAYSAIDTYHMTGCTIDEAVRRLVAVGADFDQIGGVDNFCWPNIQFHPQNNPDGKLKAAKLVRSCRALREICLAYEIPLLSGKDSMYVDGHLQGRYKETHKVSALETLQFSATSIVRNINKCITMDSKVEGDLVYILGATRNELGGSEYYAHLGYVGLNVPEVVPEVFIPLYRELGKAMDDEIVASAHGIYRGGLGVHLALVAMGGNLGMKIDLGAVPVDQTNRDDVVLFSESAGRFIVTIDPRNRETFEQILSGLSFACIGAVTGDNRFVIKGIDGKHLVDVSVNVLKIAWKKPFGELI
ncbi:MAG: AIR synthase-related protein [Desulfobacterales bacterium]